MTEPFIIHVTEADFEYEVIQFSLKTPVVVDFWADWCIPCRTLGPLLLQLAQEAQGGFRLAKVDVDENPKLAQRFNVRGIPAIKGFRDGLVAAELSGVLAEKQVRKFIEELIPKTSDLLLEKGESLLKLEQWGRAEATFHEVLTENPQHPGALLGLVKCLLVQGEGAQALDILNRFPASREFGPAQQMRPLAEALASDKAWIRESERLIDAKYGRALQLIGRSNLPAAMDGLLAVLREDKHYRNDEARQLMIGLFEILGNENPLTRQYRAELASVLY